MVGSCSGVSSFSWRMYMCGESLRLCVKYQIGTLSARAPVGGCNGVGACVNRTSSRLALVVPRS